MGVETYDQDLEDRITRIVSKIKKARNRPCYQNILTKLKTGGKAVEMNDLKVFIDNMVKNGLLEQKFILRDELEFESFSLGGDKSFVDDIEEGTPVKDQSESDDCFITQDAYINNMICDVITNKIQDEVRNQLEKINILNVNKSISAECTNDRSLHSHVSALPKIVKECEEINKTCNKCNNSSNSNDNLVKALQSEITFLRSEMYSKDEIIKMLVLEKKTSTVEVSKPEAVPTLTHSYVNKASSTRTKVEKATLDKKKESRNQPSYQSQQKKNNNRNVTICGDSVIKGVRGYEMKKTLPKNTKAYVRTESGATTEDMIDYVNPSRKHKPALYILHCGTNDLRTGKQPTEIANEIIELAMTLKTNENDVAVSSIIVRNDRLDSKGKEVNNILESKCPQLKLGFIMHNNIQKSHLNYSGLHLTEDGDKLLSANFVNYIKL